MRKNYSFTYFNFLILCMWLQVINKVKITHQGEGHIKVKIKISSSLPTLCKFYLFTILILCMWLLIINKVKVTHQGEDHIKVKVKYLHPFKFYVARALCKRVVCIRLKCYLFRKHSVHNFSRNSRRKTFSQNDFINFTSEFCEASDIVD